MLTLSVAQLGIARCVCERGATKTVIADSNRLAQLSSIFSPAAVPRAAVQGVLVLD